MNAYIECLLIAMKAPDDKGLRAMAFYECIHPKITMTELEEQEQRMTDCSAEQNSTSGISLYIIETCTFLMLHRI